MYLPALDFIKFKYFEFVLLKFKFLTFAFFLYLISVRSKYCNRVKVFCIVCLIHKKQFIIIIIFWTNRLSVMRSLMKNNIAILSIGSPDRNVVEVKFSTLNWLINFWSWKKTKLYIHNFINFDKRGLINFFKGRFE